MLPLPRSTTARWAPPAWVGLVGLGAAAGVAAGAVAPLVAEAGRKFVALGVVSLLVLVAAAASRRGRDVLLFTWVVSLTYNRQFWSFGPLVGDHGAFGPYWMVADLVFAALLAEWAFRAVVLRQPPAVHSVRFLPWYGPFAVVATLSVLGTPEPAWAIGDLLRVWKLGLVLLYFRHNVSPREWWVVVGALGAALGLQSTLAVIEVVSGRTGVLWILGVGGSDAGARLGIDELFGGWTRGTGTVAHPPYLAAFILLTAPVFCSIALAAGGRARRAAAAVAVLGLVGLVCTLARLPVVVVLVQLVLLLALLIGLRLLALTRAAAVAAIAGLVLAAFGIAFADRIHDRLTRDLGPSVSERVAEYEVALRMVSDRPFLGVGLNNYGAYMKEYGSHLSWGIERRWHDASTQVTHMRLLAGPLNGFLYVATVTGLAGLASFVWLAAGGLALGWRAVLRTTGGVRAACLGMVVGMAGLYMHQSLSYSIWIDTVISVWTVMIALVGCAASSRRAGAPGPPGS